MKIIIIGGGIAGTTAAEEIRKQDSATQITIIDRENYPCYSRVLLMPYVNDKVEREKMILKKPEWYTQKNIELMSDVEVTKIDSKNKFVETSEGRELPYDKLLITAGLNVRYTPEDKRGVVYFKTLDDADQLKSLIKEAIAQKKNKAVIYGGGFIAMDYLAIFDHYKFDTTVLMRSGGFWSKVLSAHAQQVLKDQTELKGIKIINDVREIELIGETELTGVCALGQEFETSILGVGIGLDPDKAVLSAAGIEVGAGIICDKYLQTNVEDIYAAGDIAEYDDATIGRHIRYGNWTNAIMQGKAVALNMVGEKIGFSMVSSYATNLLGKEIVFIGDVDRTAADEVVQEVADKQNSTELFIRNKKIVGAVIIGDVSKRTEITKRIQNREAVSY